MASDTDGTAVPNAYNAREIERRNRESSGKPLSPVMKAAATACELAHAKPPPRRER